MIVDIILLIAGFVSLVIGADALVSGASSIAKKLKIPSLIIGLTIVAFSTSLPELITSVTATRRGEVDLGIGNILGSQIFNIFLIIGTSSIITPITYEISYNFDMILLLIASCLFAIFPFVKPKDKMSSIEGIIFLVIYAYYLMHAIFA